VGSRARRLPRTSRPGSARGGVEARWWCGGGRRRWCRGRAAGRPTAVATSSSSRPWRPQPTTPSQQAATGSPHRISVPPQLPPPFRARGRPLPPLRLQRMPSRREEMQFCISSLLHGQFAFTDAFSAGGFAARAQSPGRKAYIRLHIIVGLSLTSAPVASPMLATTSLSFSRCWMPSSMPL
jgi:hypothetical protein